MSIYVCNTQVISLFGGPGSGKSSISAQLYADMKQQQLNVELVREYVKDWAWSERIVGPLDQPFIAGKQTNREAALYGKVDYLVTDSPFLLSGFYQQQGNKSYVEGMLLGFKEHAGELGVTYHNYLIRREKPYDPRGRWQTEEEAKNFDRGIREYLDRLGESYIVISGDARIASKQIQEHLGNGTTPTLPSY